MTQEPRGVIAHPVAVPPHPRVVVEVRLAQPGAVRVVPEHHRHRRHRLGDHQLADLVDERLARLVVGLDLARRATRRRSRPATPARSAPTPTNPVHTSVPPDIEPIWIVRARRRRRSSGSRPADSGEPVEPIDADAGQVVLVARPQARLQARLQERRRRAEQVTRCCSASRHSAPRSGWPGLPSYSTTVAPTSRPPMRKFHIIQPVVVNQKNRSPGAEVQLQRAATSGARARSRRARARSAWAARWCPRSTAPTAGGRTAPARRPARRGVRGELVPARRVPSSVGSPSDGTVRRAASAAARAAPRPWAAMSKRLPP